MDVSIIIVNYHTSDLVRTCISSIIKETKKIQSYEVIVVDNHSENEIQNVVESFHQPNIRLITANTNLGFGKANNLGEKSASGKYLFLLNPDTVLINDAISVLYHFMEENHDVGIAGGNLYTPEGKPNGSYCRAFGSVQEEKGKSKFLRIVNEKIGQKLHLNNKNKGFNYTDKPLTVGYVYGADMMLKKSLFDKVGGFDPDFFMYGEETELTFRINKLGFKTMNVPQARIIHLEGASSTVSSNRFNEKQFRMRMNGTMLFFMKCYGKNSVNQFFKYRSRRYKNLIRIAKIQGKLTGDFMPQLQLSCLEDEYHKFIRSDLYGRNI